MLNRLKANILFEVLLKRHDINKAYKMVGPEDSWYDTISTVHKSLAEIQKLPHEDWQITSHDGLKLKGIFYPGSSNKTMIWIHGYTSHAERESAFPGLFYHSLGFNVLIPYLRAHGPSEGKYISFGALERMDLQRWVEKVNDRIPQGQILLHGLSMGGGIALDLAVMEMENVKCLVVDAPSHSIEGFFSGVAQHTCKKNPEKVFTQLCSRFEKEFSADPMVFDRVENIKNGRYPLLLTAGSMEEQDTLLNKIKENNPQNSAVLILPGCNHGNGMYKQTQLYQNAIRQLIAENMTR